MLKQLLLCLSLTASASTFALPKGFVYLNDIDPSIKQEMRYAGNHNFMGRPFKGYETSQCILTQEAAESLAKIQAELHKSGLSLKVYDCYRPQMAVDDIIAWSKVPELQTMKAEFYPNVNKADFFTLGYVAEKSGHTRGSTIDLTIADMDMGSAYDLLDPKSGVMNPHRLLLRNIMIKYGFNPYEKEWWHFTLKNEPYPETYFNFPIIPPQRNFSSK